MRSRALPAALLVVVLVGGAFVLGRASVDRGRPAPARGSFEDGLRSGREAAFSGFDGGWAYGKPYIVVLRRGGPETTYRIASRRPLLPGVEYRACGGTVCSRER